VLPDKWHAGLTAHVKWNVSNWKDNAGSGSYEADVPVDRYTEHGHVWVHFLADGTVRVVVSNYGPRNPNYPGPHDPIPQKQPWYMYPARRDHRDSKERYADYDVAEKRCATATDAKACENDANNQSLDEQLGDARRYLPPCASMAGDVVNCARAADEHMRAARWARRCQAEPGLPECASK
jgi:hypothetical protein